VDARRCGLARGVHYDPSMKRITGFLAAAALCLAACAACKDDAKTSTTTGTSSNRTGDTAAGERPERHIPQGPLAQRAAPQRQAPPDLPSGEPDQRQRRDDRRAERIAEFDSDGDGQLSDAERAQMREARQAEREARRAEMIAELDKNADGQLDESERQAMRQQRVQGTLDRLDANRDGKLSPDELAARNADADANSGRRRRGPPPIDFATADTSHDGALSSDELGAAMPEPRRGRRGFDGPPPDDAPAD